MSLALYLNDNEAQQFHDFVVSSEIVSQRRNIGFHISFKTGVSANSYGSSFLWRVINSHSTVKLG